MKAKTFIILLVVLCLLSGAAYISLSNRGGKGKNRQIGVTPYASLPMESIKKISIYSSDADIPLERVESLWVVKGKYDFPVDFTLITELVSRMKTMKIGRSFQASDDALTRLGLHLPDAEGVDTESKGIRIVMKDARDEVLLDVVLGKTREMMAGAGGHYILAMPEQTVYLVDTKFDKVGKTATDWIEKDILDIKAGDIRSVTCYPLNGEKSIYTLRRPEKDKEPKLTDAPGARLDPSKIDDVYTALEPLTIDDVAGYVGDPVESEITYTHEFEYKLFDGTSYRLIPGRTGDGDQKKFFVKITVGDKTNAIDRDGKEIPSPVINRVIHKWVYLIPEWKFNRFITDRDKLLQKK